MKLKKEAFFMHNKNDGISLRTIQLWLIIGAALISGLMFFSTYHLSIGFRRLANASEQQIELRKAARELMDASDYLTEKVQRFAVQGDQRFMEEYFHEAFEANRREEAVEIMSREIGGSAALMKLRTAMDHSLELMNQEYYAMRLVIEAKGYTQYPEVLQSVELSARDQALDAQAKMRRALEMVFDDEYYAQKEQIREEMRDCVGDLEIMSNMKDASALQRLSRELVFVRIIMIVQMIGAAAGVFLTARLGIHPILKAVDRIKADSLIPEVGANEFRYLARTYNKMYEVYKKSLERLNFKASHDELTGVYNRAGYELLKSGIDMNSTYMILFDVDNFKTVNDTYGHEVGDQILKKTVRVLKNNFRSDDYICRIGGDEFVVFLVHATEIQRELIAVKIDKINRELAETDDGLPSVSLSVGIAHGADAAEQEDLFRATDKAMYNAKKKGKRTYTFYSKKGD